MIGSPDGPAPTGFLDIADITIRTVLPATPAATQHPDVIAYGIEDEPLDGSLADYLADAEGYTFTLVDGSAAHGSVTIEETTGAYRFTPEANYYGPGRSAGAPTFQFMATDGEGATQLLTAYLFIAPVNDAPEAASLDEGFAIAADQPFANILFKGTDADGDRLSFQAVGGSVLNGILQLDSRSGHYVFTPEPGFTGEASFAYVVSDGQVASEAKTVTFTVHESQELPAAPTYFEAIDNYLLAGDLLGFARWTIYLAERGDANAFYHYGTWLAEGRFVTRDTGRAVLYLEQARITEADAALQLAKLNTEGDGCSSRSGIMPKPVTDSAFWTTWDLARRPTMAGPSPNS
jgi:hypothetical protein